MPEFTAPVLQKVRAAVADSSASLGGAAVADPSAASGDAAVAGSSASLGEEPWMWGQGHPETMHPFWAVRRITQQQLDKEIEACIRRNKTAVAGTEWPIPSFNCEFQRYSQSQVNIATVGNTSVTGSRLVHVPILTNCKALVKGEELLMQLTVVVKKKQQQKRTWREVRKEEQRATKASRTRAAGTPTSGVDVD